MDLNLPLLLLAASSSLLLAVRSAFVRPRAWDWLLVALVILAAAGVGFVFAFEVAGLVSFGLWAVLVLGPILLTRLQAWALVRQRYALALALARALVVLHPSRTYRATAPRVRALRHAAAGDRALAERALDEYATFGPAAQAEARLERVRLGTDPEEVRTVVLALEDARVFSGPVVALGLIRALAEIGDLEGAIARYRISERLFEPEPAEQLRTTASLVLFAAAGRVEGVEAILGARLRGASAEIKTFWRAAAGNAAGDESAARTLHALASSEDGVIRRAARIRLAPSSSGQPLALADEALLDRLAQRVEEEDRYRFGAARKTTPLSCHALAAVTGLVFVVSETIYLAERSAGATRSGVLEQMGALSASAVLDRGEWWRLVAPLFLHYGAAHAIFNLLGLYFLGPFVERALGKERFLITYFASGLAGTALYVARAALFSAPTDYVARETILVGASGSIMGLLGASVAILARGAFRERIRSARARLRLVAVILVLQMVFDQLIAEISSFAHTVGVLAGLLLGLALTAGGARNGSPARPPRSPR